MNVYIYTSARSTPPGQVELRDLKDTTDLNDVCTSGLRGAPPLGWLSISPQRPAGSSATSQAMRRHRRNSELRKQISKQITD